MEEIKVRLTYKNKELGNIIKEDCSLEALIGEGCKTHVPAQPKIKKRKDTTNALAYGLACVEFVEFVGEPTEVPDLCFKVDPLPEIKRTVEDVKKELKAARIILVKPQLTFGEWNNSLQKVNSLKKELAEMKKSDTSSRSNPTPKERAEAAGYKVDFDGIKVDMFFSCPDRPAQQQTAPSECGAVNIVEQWSSFDMTEIVGFPSQWLSLQPHDPDDVLVVQPEPEKNSIGQASSAQWIMPTSGDFEIS